MYREYREDKTFTTSENWNEGDTLIIRRAEAYSKGTTRKYKRKVKYNTTDGLYFILDNRKYFEYEFNPIY